MSLDSIAGTGGPGRAAGLFHEASPNGEVATPPALPLPPVPPMPRDFSAPADAPATPDARSGADQLG